MEERSHRTEPVFSKKLRAGRRRTYFIDVRTTKASDYFVTITESKKRGDDTYERHKIFLYKEDFNKFIEALNHAVDHVKNDLLPEYDFNEFNRDEDIVDGLASMGDKAPIEANGSSW